MAGSSSALSQLLPISLWERTIFVKCIPAPATFTQRRAVLRALQKNTSEGIEVFKKLKRNSGSFIAVTTKPEVAEALIQESPFERTLIAEDPTTVEELKKTTWGSLYGLPRTITAPVNPLPKLEPTPATGPSNELGLSHTTFTIRCFPPNRTYNHLEAISTNPLHGPWPDTGGRESFISAALRRSVPSGPLAPALRDWTTGNQLSRDPGSPADDAGEGALSIILGRPRPQAYTKERARARLKLSETPEIMKSLVAFAAKCRDEPGARENQLHPALGLPFRTKTPLRSTDSKDKISGSSHATAEVHDNAAATDMPESFLNHAPTKEREKLLDDTTFKDMMASSGHAPTKKGSKSGAR